MGLRSVQKISRSGNSLTINVPKKIAEILEIKLGDYVEIDFGEVIKRRNNKERSLPKINKEWSRMLSSEEFKEFSLEIGKLWGGGGEMETNITICDYCQTIKKQEEGGWIDINLSSIKLSNRLPIELEIPQAFCCKSHLLKYIKFAVKEAKRLPRELMRTRNILRKQIKRGLPQFPKYVDKPKIKDDLVFEIDELVGGFDDETNN